MVEMYQKQAQLRAAKETAEGKITVTKNKTTKKRLVSGIVKESKDSVFHVHGVEVHEGGV